jgi:prepilin-type N-terminal cleavage/methylation domain-containing protein
MRVQKHNPKQGFTLLELMISMALGLIVLATMTSLFKTGMDTTRTVMQRAETQQNMRAAIDLMVKDITMAGAGLPLGGMQLPNGTGSSLSKFGCDQGGTCHVPAFTYPANYMYGVIPGFKNGVEANAVVPSAPAPAINDSITVIYVDYNCVLQPVNYDLVTFPIPGSGTKITIGTDVVPAPPLITSAGQVQVGDLILLQNSLGAAVGEVTNLDATSITFADLDPLNMNQDGAKFNNIKSISLGSGTIANRLLAVTYYLTVPANGQTPRLMRQVNGLPPVPVADDIINLQFSYDVYNSTTSALDPNQADPIGNGESPSLMQKINVALMGQSISNYVNKSQNMYLTTSVSARNMAFRSQYKPN